MANWVATEPGQPFRLNYRIYLPQDTLLDPNHVADLTFHPSCRPDPDTDRITSTGPLFDPRRVRMVYRQG